jgi:hypothetical protein
MARVLDSADLTEVVPDRLHQTFAVGDDGRLVLGCDIGRRTEGKGTGQNESSHQLDGQTSHVFSPG